MARINNKINLPTNTTDIKMLANYLSAIEEKKVVAVAEEQELFSNVKAQYSRKKKETHARDTHTKAALSLYGLIDINDDGSFSVSAIGKEVVNCFSSKSNYSREDKIALMLKVFVRMKIVDIPNNRRIHIGFVILKLLCDFDLNFYITNQELAHVVMNPAFISDDQYDEIKQYILDFRNSNIGISQFAPQTKAATFMTTFVTNWEFLTSEDSLLTPNQNKLADKYFASWLKQASEEDDDEDNLSEEASDENSVQEIESEDDSQSTNDGADETTKLNASQKNAKRAFHSIIKYRLHTLSAYIAKIYLSLLEGVEVKDYLSYFTGKNGLIQERTFMDKPLQIIFYGAPGTGKSHQVNKVSKNYSTIRTTFHPDSDYSTFVGAYKPTMTKVRKSVVIGQDEKEVKGLGGNEYENKIQYSFVKQAFLKAYLGAWKKYTEPETNEEGKEVVSPQFLVIEEINRGNCAQIFGDLFQLLDRQEKNGFSCYPIEADADLQQEIENAFLNEAAYKLTNAISVEGKVEGYTSNYQHEDGTPCTLSEDIQSGRILLLPNNLYIWATMNTSDQSLFPIDSAFKRRWEWEYIRISEGRDKDTHEPLRYSFNVNGTDYDWWSFIQKINERVGSITSSEDKKLGYFFCGTEKNISAAKFVGKVCFYLWNDVFKDFGFGKKDQSAAFKKADGKDITFDDFYKENPETFKSEVNEVLLGEFIKKLGVETVADRQTRESQPAQVSAPQQESPATTEE